MVDPVFTYVGGIAFLVLIIGSMLYLTFSTLEIDEGDEHPGESVVGGVGEEEDAAEEEFEPAEPLSEDSPELVDEDPADREKTEEAVSADESDAGNEDADEEAGDDGTDEDADEEAGDDGADDADVEANDEPTDDADENAGDAETDGDVAVDDAESDETA